MKVKIRKGDTVEVISGRLEDKGKRGEAGGETVQITAAELNWLTQTWTQQRQRPPTAEEMQGMLVDYVREGLLAREARDLKLDENDIIIRRRLAQKMRFLVEDTAGLAEPSDEELRRIYTAQAAQYQSPPQLAFTQRYFHNAAAAQAALAKLQRQPNAEVGENTLLERDYPTAEPPAVASVFGPAFATALFALPAGQWQGPIASGYGYHLVRIDARQDAQSLPFESVRPQLREAWQREQQVAAYDRHIAGLMKKYRLVADDSIRPLLAPLYQARP